YGCRNVTVIPGWCVSTRPGISRFRVRCFFASPRNDSFNAGPSMPDIHPLAGKPVPPSMLANIPRLVTAYFAGKLDPKIATQRVAFGTSGHRGSAFNLAFNEAHILAIRPAVCDHPREKNLPR